MSSYLSTARAKELIAEAVAEHPERLNPRQNVGGACVYTSRTDPTLHCIAGEVCARAGIPMKHLTEGRGFALTSSEYELKFKLGFGLRRYMSKETVLLIGRVQYVFDDFTHKRKSWSMAYAECQWQGIL